MEGENLLLGNVGDPHLESRGTLSDVTQWCFTAGWVESM